MPESQPKVLMIDDERRYTARYVEELEENGYKVTFIKDIQAASDHLRAYGSQYAYVILDMMMPPSGDLTPELTNYGLETGLALLPQVRVDAPQAAIFILTNWNQGEINNHQDKFESCTVCLKQYTKPWDLSGILKGEHP